MRRGLTMVETLLALSLLAVVMVAVISWIGVTARTGALAAEPARWRAAADAILSLVADDVTTGDFGSQAPRRTVQVIGRVLEIHTRRRGAAPAGSIVRRYRLDERIGELQVQDRSQSGRRTTRTVLTGVDEWTCAIDDERRVLSVTIASDRGWSTTGRFPLP